MSCRRRGRPRAPAEDDASRRSRYVGRDNRLTRGSDRGRRRATAAKWPSTSQRLMPAKTATSSTPSVGSASGDIGKAEAVERAVADGDRRCATSWTWPSMSILIGVRRARQRAPQLPDRHAPPSELGDLDREEDAASRPTPAASKNGRPGSPGPETQPMSTGVGTPVAMTSRTASSVSGSRSPRAMLLNDPIGMIPRAASVPISASAAAPTVPSPAATATSVPASAASAAKRRGSSSGSISRRLASRPLPVRATASASGSSRAGSLWSGGPDPGFPPASELTSSVNGRRSI